MLNQGLGLTSYHRHWQICDYGSVTVAKNIVDISKDVIVPSGPCRFEILQLKLSHHYCHILTRKGRLISLKAGIEELQIPQIERLF